jgi:hypothetical protein
MKYTLPLTDVMNIHNLSRNELYRYIKTSKLAAEKRGHPAQWHFDPEQVEALRLERVQIMEIQIAQISESVKSYLERTNGT